MTEGTRAKAAEGSLDTSASPVCYVAPVGLGGVPALPRSALEHVDSLYRVAHRLTRDDEDAADLVQETYVRALAGRASFTADTNLRAWLFRILRNAHVDAYRRKQASPVERGSGEAVDAADSLAQREPLRGDAELERLRRVVSRDLTRALASLTVDARTLVLLDLEGFTGEELATVFDCAVGTIKSRLSRARELLREHLGDYGG